MPTPETLARFIARVEENAHDRAIEEFYTEDASMQENQAPPRVGREAHVASERRVLARARSVRSERVRPVFASGDRVGLDEADGPLDPEVPDRRSLATGGG